jgi:hypothetical protein
MVLGRPVFDASAPLLRVRGRRISNWWTNLETLGAGIDDSLYGFRVYPVAPLVEVMRGQHWMRRFDFDTEAVVRLAWRGIRPVNLAAPVKYLRPEEGGVSHFRYGWRQHPADLDASAADGRLPSSPAVALGTAPRRPAAVRPSVGPAKAAHRPACRHPPPGDTGDARQHARASDQVVSMSSRFILVATLATAATLAWQSAAAQDSASAPVSREQRKAETATANKAWSADPGRQGGAPVSKSAAPSGSTVSREQRKAETAAANKAGELTPGPGRRAAAQDDQDHFEQDARAAQGRDLGSEEEGRARARRPGESEVAAWRHLRLVAAFLDRLPWLVARRPAGPPPSAGVSASNTCP